MDTENSGSKAEHLCFQRANRPKPCARQLKEKKVFLLNLMSAPGSGKTTTLRRTIAALKDELRIGVMEADIDSDVDARAIAETGTKADPAAYRRHVPPGRRA